MTLKIKSFKSGVTDISNKGGGIRVNKKLGLYLFLTFVSVTFFVRENMTKYFVAP